MKTIKLLLHFFKLPILVFAFSMTINHFGAYSAFPIIDIPMHIIGGAAIAHTFTLIFKSWEESSILTIKNKLIHILLIVSIVALVAILWEFWEFLMTQILNSSWQGNLEDTMLDFLMGLVGGLTVATFSQK